VRGGGGRNPRTGGERGSLSFEPALRGEVSCVSGGARARALLIWTQKLELTTDLPAGLGPRHVRVDRFVRGRGSGCRAAALLYPLLCDDPCLCLRVNHSL
jgi:hypothetical protein